MLHKKANYVKREVEKTLLPAVRKPGRYIGGEMNAVRKDLDACEVRVGLCFPDIYEIGMSHTGLGLLYEALNRREGTAAERIFAPWTDAEAVMREAGIPLFSLESKATAGSFDFLGFSLTNELCYTNVLNMLDLAGLEVRAEQRGEDDPLVLVGGQASNIAEPIAAFVDLFVLGQGEEAVVELVELYRRCKRAGEGKEAFLLAAARELEFVYVPRFYEFAYDGGRVTEFRATREGLRTRFENAVVRDFENAAVPAAPILPWVQAVHDRISIEVMRGCPGRCRFCQASFCRRPIRYRSVDRIVEIARQQYEHTGYDTISLLSLSTGEYPWLEELIEKLTAYFAPRHVGLSVPSLRVDQQLQILPKLVSSVRKSGLTIAVEAATERLRAVINKPITDEDLLAAVKAAYEAGFQKVKLYFMAGLPGETIEDVRRIVDLSYEVARARRPVDGKLATVNAAVSWFVPKPHTPFGWFGQRPRSYFEDCHQAMIDRKYEINARCVQIKFHEMERSVLESAMGRGDRRMTDVIETAWREGATFDLWNETFEMERWRRAFAAHGMDLDGEAQRAYEPGQLLPWAHLGGPDEPYLLKHYYNAVGLAGGG